MIDTGTSRFLLEIYFNSLWDEERSDAAAELLRRAKIGTDEAALEGLVDVLRADGNSDLRLQIVECLRAARLPAAVPELVKTIFDGDARVRAVAAETLVEYAHPRTLAFSLSPLLDAVNDPATSEAAVTMIRRITGKPPEKITPSERERLRAGDHPSTIWTTHFATLPAL